MKENSDNNTHNMSNGHSVHHRHGEKANDPTSEFRRYMFSRSRRRKFIENTMMGILIMIAISLILFIVFADMFEG